MNEQRPQELYNIYQYQRLRNSVFDRDKLSVPEAMSFGTVRIVANLCDGQAVGTGFFYNFQSATENVTPAIITNKHVIEGARSLDIIFHVRPWPATTPEMGMENMLCRIDLVDSPAIPHPSEDVDLCAILTGPLDHRMRACGIELLYVCSRSNHMMDEAAESELQGLDSVVMVGYPNEVWDSTNNMPVMRRGVTASHARLDYEGRKDILLDVGCYPGSSGSPVFWFETGTIINRIENSVANGWRVRLLGVLYAAHEYTSEGEIRVVSVPTSSQPVPFTSVPMNLGIAMKSFRVLELEIAVDRVLLGFPSV